MLRGNYLSLYCCCEFFLVEKNLTFDLLDPLYNKNARYEFLSNGFIYI